MRRVQLLKIAGEGSRDNGRLFQLTEASAVQGEDWAARAIILLAKAGFDIPDDIAKAGVAGVAVILQSFNLSAIGNVAWYELKPILDEMMALCVRRISDPNFPDVTRSVNDDDFEEVKTLLTIRKALIALHVGFSPAVGT